MSRSRYRVVGDGFPHFLTCTVLQWLPVFTRPETVDILFDSLRFLQEQDRLVIYGYVILENHMHMLASSPDLGKEVGNFKSYTARCIIEHLQERGERQLLELLTILKAGHKKDRKHQLWQEGSHPQQIQNREMMRQKLDYIHQNPVKRGYIDEPTHWRYSSARNYAGQEGLLSVTMDW